MNGSIRTAIICNTEKKKIFQKNLNSSLFFFENIDSAIKADKEIEFEIVFLQDNLATNRSIRKVKKFIRSPTPIILYSNKVTRSSKSWNQAGLKLIPDDISIESLENEIKKFRKISQKKQRAKALKKHTLQHLDSNDNPILSLLLKIIAKCALLDSKKSILNIIDELKKAFNFDFSIFIDENGSVIEQKNNNSKFNTTELHDFYIDKNSEKVTIFNKNDLIGSKINKITNKAWTNGILITFDRTAKLNNKGQERPNYICVLKNELIPFILKDKWILEILWGPLALGIEKSGIISETNSVSMDWKSTFNAISEPITIVDKHNNIIQANEAFSNFIGSTTNKIIGKDCDKFLKRKTKSELNIKNSKIPQKIKFNTSNLKTINYLMWSYPVKFSKHSFEIRFYRNVSKKAHLLSTLVQSEKMATLGKLIGAIAHEVNNPLAGIIATAQVIRLDQKNISDSISEDLLEIENAAHRARKIIDNLLGFSNESEIEDESIDIQELVNTTLTFAKVALKKTKIQTNFDLNNHIVKLPKSNIQQILFNLISNSAQAMSRGGSLTINVSIIKNNLNLTVADTGKGISKEQIENIFDPFYSSKIESGGTGLGLSIVKTLVYRMNGNISVESQINIGTKFKITIPI